MRVHDYAAGAPGIELKGDEGDPNEVVTKALADLTKVVEQRAGDMKGIADRLDKLEAKANRPGSGGTGKVEDPDAAAERKAFAEYLARGDRAAELKTLRESSDAQGGYLAPDEMSTEMVRNLVEFSPVRPIASVRTTGSPAVKYPKRTGVTNASWDGELEDATESEPSFGMHTVTVHKLQTYVDISNELLQDSAGMAEAEVRLALAEDFGKKEGAAFISGDGVNKPLGMLSDTSVGYTATGNASTLGSAPADLLISLMYALPAAYRNRGTWLMNGTTLAAVRKLKDGAGNYLWSPAYTEGQPETLLGRPVVEAVDMPDVGSAAEPIIFGDVESAYRIVDRLALSILVNPYLLASKGVTRIHATRRLGGSVIRPEAIRKVRCATS